VPGTRTVDLLVTGAAEVVTCAGDGSDPLGAVSGGVAVDGGTIVAVGDVSGIVGRRTIDATGCVVMPGFVDAHTHVVFGGTRVQEYAARVAGLEPPPDAPVGIVGTTEQTRARTLGELVAKSAERVIEMRGQGTTTVESKSGYGLDSETELRILRASRLVGEAAGIDVVSTYLGAHAFPTGMEPERYIDEVIDLIPQVTEEGLAEFCDVYCDEGYFTLDQTRRILEAGAAAGLRPKLHLDAYSHTGAAALAAELGAVSVDHLNHTTYAEMVTLAAAGAVGVYMPCLDYATAHPEPLDPRRLRDAGMEIALATDCCPGCWTTSMQLAVQMACRTGGLSVREALRAATLGAAAALGRADRVGSLEAGKQADILVLDVPSHEDIAYRLGRNSARTVIRRGTVVEGIA
jgi:imidazolonepropionase